MKRGEREKEREGVLKMPIVNVNQPIRLENCAGRQRKKRDRQWEYSLLG